VRDSGLSVPHSTPPCLSPGIPPRWLELPWEWIPLPPTNSRHCRVTWCVSHNPGSLLRLSQSTCPSHRLLSKHNTSTFDDAGFLFCNCRRSAHTQHSCVLRRFGILRRVGTQLFLHPDSLSFFLLPSIAVASLFEVAPDFFCPQRSFDTTCDVSPSKRQRTRLRKSEGAIFWPAFDLI